MFRKDQWISYEPSDPYEVVILSRLLECTDFQEWGCEVFSVSKPYLETNVSKTRLEVRIFNKLKRRIRDSSTN